MKIPVPKEMSFDCPDGFYRAKLIDVRPKIDRSHGSVQELVRLTFQVFAPPAPGKIIVAGKNFVPSLGEGSPLREMLDEWLGAEYMKTFAGGEFAMKDHIGKEADIVTVHIHNPEYPKPFVDIQGVYPSGTLTLTYNPEQGK